MIGSGNDAIATTVLKYRFCFYSVPLRPGSQTLRTVFSEIQSYLAP